MLKKEKYVAPEAEPFMSWTSETMLQVTKSASFSVEEEADWGDDVIEPWDGKTE